MHDGTAYQTLGARRRHGLDAHAGIFADLFRAAFQHFVVQKIDELFHFLRAGAPFDSGVHVFGIFAEDHHVHAFRLAHRRGYTWEITHRPHTRVEIENLAQRDVQRNDAAAHRSREWAFNRHAEIANRVDAIL